MTAATKWVRIMRAATLALCVGICAALVWPAAAVAKTWTVKITGMRFEPATVTVASGDRIVWVNEDPVAHTVTSVAAGRFDSRAIAPGGRWRHEAARPGRYAYACAFHPPMQAMLIVKPKP